MSEFQTVAKVNELPPGQGMTVRVDGHVCALFNVDGQFYAIDNSCPHKGGPLGEGFLESHHVYCPLHGWQFDVRTGTCMDRPDKPVKTYPLRVVDGQIQVSFT